MKKTSLKIITPQKTFWDSKIELITVKTTEGYITVHYGKSPFIASLDIADLKIKDLTKKYIDCAIAGGILSVTPTSIKIITDAIENRKDIDINRAKRKKEEAEKILLLKKDITEIHNAELSLKKALNRLSKTGK